MHLEVLVEDRSGCIMLEAVLTKILGRNGTHHTWRIHSYRGIGRIPRNLHATPDRRTRLLLHHLPSVLRGYGRSLPRAHGRVVVVVDLDNKDCRTFKGDLVTVLNSCDPQPYTLFRIAIEEGEAWLLGDQDALRAAYPTARNPVLNNYVQDSICGTWEMLADAIYTGGAAQLGKLGYPIIGRVKCEWAARIAPHMDVDQNDSRSFQAFRDGVKALAGIR